MEYKIAVISGDGIGPEITREAEKAMVKVGQKYGHRFTFNHVLAGGCAIDEVGQCLPNETLKHEWQTALCGGANCKRKFQFRGAMRPTERDPENFVIQSRPFPLRKPNGKFATTGAD